jgi:hypothetical protein
MTELCLLSLSNSVSGLRLARYLNDAGFDIVPLL